MDRPTIVILGAGLGGAIAAFDIRHALGDRARVVVISRGDTFHFTPSNPWVAVHWRKRDAIEVSLPEVMRRKEVDTCALLRSALPKDLDWLQESGSVTMLDGAATALLDEWTRRRFVRDPEGAPDDEGGAGPRFDAAVHRLTAAGVPTVDDRARGAARYAQLRGRWAARLRALAVSMDYPWREIAPTDGPEA